MLNKKILAVAVASAFAGGVAQAGNITLSGATAGAIYATEIKTTTPPTLTNANVYGATTGWGFSSGTAIFVRYDLSGGTFAADPASLQLADPSTVTVLANVTSTKNSGGAAGTSVIYQLTSSNSLNSISTANALLTLAGIKITSTASPLTLTQCVYDTAANAVAAGTTGKLSACQSGTIVSFSPSYTVSATANTATADVASANGSYKTFTGAINATTAALGTLTFANTTNTVLLAGGLTSQLDSIAGTGSAIVVTGDFTAASSDGVYDAAARARVKFADSTCTTAGTTTIASNSVTATSATFFANQVTGLSGTLANTTLCLTAQGNTAIPVGSYTAVFTPVAQTTAYVVSASSSLSVGSIARNGGQLMTPYMTTASGYISRVVLTNSSSSATTYAVSLKGEVGTTITANAAGATGTIPANGMIVVKSSDIATSVSGNSRIAATFTFASPRANIDGHVQVVQVSTGAFSSVLMVAPGTN